MREPKLRVWLFAPALVLLACLNLEAQPADDIARLKEQLALQQKQIDQLREALARQEQLLSQFLQASERQHQPDTAQLRGPALPQVSSQLAAPKPAPAQEQAAGNSFERIRFRNIYLSPGGFVEAAAMWRSHNQNADVGSTFGSIPLSGTANSRLSELRASARQSRLALLAETEVRGVKASGYFEADFLGAAPTANEVESNSFQPRLRQFWGTVDLPGGFSVTAGQMWSLLTTYRSGLEPRSEWIPLTIDAQYVVGYNWARQFGLRLTKSLGSKSFAAVSVENPETNISGVVLPSGALGFNNSPNATAPSSGFTTSITPGSNGVSTDAAPDVLGKLAFDPGWGHWELKAVGRTFRARLNGSNHTTF